MIRGAAVRFADRAVFSDVDLTVGAHDRIAVIGDNGAGKSTLLHVIAGSVPLSAGERRVELPGGLAVAAQHPEFPPGATVADALDLVLSDVRDIETQIREVGETLAGAASDEQPDLLHRLGELTDRFEALGGYLIDQRVDVALDRLSLGGLDRGRPVDSLSGGERARLALAATVSSGAELLLLDEPTNDLDDVGVAWLEETLSRHRGALVVVTHDRAFLDRFATDIICVRDGVLSRYGDGYPGYLRAREAERRRRIEEYEAWRRDLARNEELVAANSFRLGSIPRKQERAAFGHGAFRARSGDHGAVGRIRQAKERVARLRENPAPKPVEPLVFAPGFGGSTSGSVDLPLLVAESVTGPALTLDRLEVHEGDRWLITGPNGAGKTTLLRVLAGELRPTGGEVRHRPGLRVSWLRQEPGTSDGTALLDAFARSTGTYREDAVEPLLSLGLFTPEDLEVPLKNLSVGQRRRFELAVAVSRPGDVLFLDEPTNHLAPELVDQLESALVDYPGAVLTVTHDRRWRENMMKEEQASAERSGRNSRSGRVRKLRVDPGGAVREVIPSR